MAPKKCSTLLITGCSCILLAVTFIWKASEKELKTNKHNVSISPITPPPIIQLPTVVDIATTQIPRTDSPSVASVVETAQSANIEGGSGGDCAIHLRHHHILAYGDSLTAGAYWQMPRRKLRYSPYKVPLEKLFTESKFGRVNVTHFGLPGWASGALLSNFRNILATRKNSIDACIILAGTNDVLQSKSMEKASENVRMMHELCEPVPTVAVTLPNINFPFGPHHPPESFGYCNPQNPGAQMKDRSRLSGMIAEGVGKKCGYVTGEIIPHKGSGESKEFWHDCVHPSAKGYEILAKEIFQHIANRIKV